jgi:putative heme-binding domain-containing protein
MGQLGTMIGCSGAMDEVGQVLDFVLRYGTDDLQTFGLLSGLGDGLLRTRSSLALVDPNGQLQVLYDAAVTDALAPVSSEALRLSAIRFLGVSPYAYTNIGLWIVALLDSGSSERVQSAVLATLGQWDDPAIVTNVLIRWRNFTPALRTQALTALLNRDSRIDTVLTALERGVISDTDFSSTQKNFLRTYIDPGIRGRALTAFGPVVIKRPEVVRQYRTALELRGIGSQGRGIFLERCAACHRYADEGKLVGPDLDGARISGKEKILSRILEPNAEVRPECQTYVLESRTGQNFVGLIRNNNPSAITFVQPEGGELIWPQAGIVSTQAQMWSLMPDGLEKGLTTQNMADLLEYLVRGAP